MTEGNRRPADWIPVWSTLVAATLGVIATAAATQVYRYASGTALAIWYVGLGFLIAVGFALPLIRQRLVEQGQCVRLYVLPNRPVRVPDDRQRAEIRSELADGTRAELLGHLDGYREPSEEVEGRDYMRANGGRGAKIRFPREDRDAEEYREEVERHVRDVTRYISAVMEANHVRLGLGLISLRVHSDTDGTLEGVRLRLWTDEDEVELFDPEDVEFPNEEPREVRPYGTSPSTWGNPFGAGIDLASFTRAVTAAPVDLGGGIEPHEDGGIVFPEFEVRDGDTKRLPPVGIRFMGKPGTRLTARWTVTANNAPGKGTGSFGIETYGADVPREDLFYGAFDDEDED